MTASPIDDDIDWWPMFHHDLNHSGYSTSTAPETNNVLWAYHADDMICLSSPAVVDNKVYFGDNNKNFYCIDSDTGEEIWKTPIPYGIGTSSPAVENGKVYFGAQTNNAGIYCLNATTGDIIWRYQTPGDDIVLASPAIYEGKVFIGAPNPDPGCMYCLDADTGDEIWISQIIDSPTSAVVYNGRVYFGSYNDNVYCLNADNGTVIWTTEVGFNRHLAVHYDKLYVDGKDFHCLNIENGDIIWDYQTDEGIYSTSCAAYGNVYFASYSGFLYCLDSDSGEKIWDFDTDSYELQSSPAVADGKIYIGTKFIDEKIYCLDAYTGEKIWDFWTTSHVFSSPAVADGKVYVGTWEDCELLCFGGTSDNNPPLTPKEILGPTTVMAGGEYSYNTSTFDPDGDQLFYKWYWELGESVWIGPFNSNVTVEINITFDYYGYPYIVKVIAKDSNHARSDWAELEVRVPRDKIIASSFLLRLFQRYPLLERFLTLFIN
jgi:outer membrane protein assembly factor BamB